MLAGGTVAAVSQPAAMVIPVGLCAGPVVMHPVYQVIHHPDVCLLLFCVFLIKWYDRSMNDGVKITIKNERTKQ